MARVAEAGAAAGGAGGRASTRAAARGERSRGAGRASGTELRIPERVLRLLHETGWFSLAALGVYLLLILLTYDRADPGWSNAVPTPAIVNAGGRVGAWLADLFLYLFGLSAWLFVLLLFTLVARGLHGLRRPGGEAPADQRFAWERWLGFLLLLAGGIAVEAVKRLLEGGTPVTFSIIPFIVLGIEMTVNAWRARALWKAAKEHSSQALAADALHRLVALAGDQHDVLWARRSDGMADGGGAVADDLDLRSAPAALEDGGDDGIGVLAARIVVGEAHPFSDQLVASAALAGRP